MWDGQTYLSGDLARGFIAILDLQGEVLQTQLFGSSASGALRFFEGAWGVNDQIFVTGMVDDGVILAGDTIVTLGGADLIVGRIDLSGTTSSSIASRNVVTHSTAYYDHLSQTLKLTTSLLRPVKYLLSSTDGRIVQAGIFSIELDISMDHFSTGPYFITFDEGGATHSLKIVHQR
jgi:hypothetical protein